jgi:hypothetical protein
MFDSWPIYLLCIWREINLILVFIVHLPYHQSFVTINTYKLKGYVNYKTCASVKL